MKYMKTPTPYGRKKCPYCHRLLPVMKRRNDENRFRLPTHGGGNITDTFYCEGSGMEVKHRKSNR